MPGVGLNLEQVPAGNGNEIHFGRLDSRESQTLADCFGRKTVRVFLTRNFFLLDGGSHASVGNQAGAGFMVECIDAEYVHSFMRNSASSLKT